ncbi:hypothetical protein DFP73DRAFT_601924 [Morchella snyderi]|nr:hypothetical protein DFP73DRAFT_601924 [Morchella snyderi]
MCPTDQQLFRAGLADETIFAECTDDKTDEEDETSSTTKEPDTIQVPVQSIPYVPKRNKANTTPKISNTKAPSAKFTSINKLPPQEDVRQSEKETPNTANKTSNKKRSLDEELADSDPKYNPVKKQHKTGETQNIKSVAVLLPEKHSDVLTNVSIPDLTAIRNAILNGVAGVTDLVKSLVNDMQQSQVGNKKLQNKIAQLKDEVTRLQMEKQKLEGNVSEMVTNKTELLKENTILLSKVSDFEKQIIVMGERITSLEATSLTEEQWEKCMEL